MNTVYINAAGSFLPGDPVGNDEAPEFLGPISKLEERLRQSALGKNGIRKRHYALTKDGEPTHTNAGMAALAAEQALARSEVAKKDVGMLCAAASQGDLLAPGIGSMVHAELGLEDIEVSSFTSFCASGMMALKTAVSAIRCGDTPNAVVCASEFASRFFRAGYLEGTRPTPDTQFLRWTLSDGSGAFVLENRPNERGLSLKVEMMDLVSYAGHFETCMYGGGKKDESGQIAKPWSNYATLEEAVKDGAFHLRQDFELLEQIIPLGLQRYVQLVEDGKIDPDTLDWVLCHFSSDHFRESLESEALKEGTPLDPDKIFTNLYEKGNTGSASIFVMLEELMQSGRLKNGQQILCMVPESGRFIISFMLLTVVGDTVVDAAPAEPETAYPMPAESKNPAVASVTRRLVDVWIDFERSLRSVPFIDKLNRGKLRMEDYRMLLCNHRQQVVEGSRWIARAASSITADYDWLRSMFLSHAHTEHRDYLMLESDFTSVGGSLEEIRGAEKNIGSEALSAWMFHQASRENPIHLFGAMFIIEGLGQRVASRWGEKIRHQLGLEPEQVSFLTYHGEADEDHMGEMWQALENLQITPEIADAIVKTAKVTARLYRLQLEELDVT